LGKFGTLKDGYGGAKFMSESGTPNKQPAPKESAIQPTKPKHSIPTPSNILNKIVNHQIASMIALAATLLGIGAAVHDACLDPDVSSDLNADPSQPFAFPFMVKNNSSWFSMNDAEIICEIEKIVMKKQSLEGFSVAPISHATIGPGEVVNFRCGAAGPGRNLFVANPGDILDAHINILVKYTMLGFSRTSSSTEFTWHTVGGTPPHWIKGRPVD
jgi:hypothetical protein